MDPDEGECTFSPRVQRAENDKVRTHKQFLKDQAKFAKERQSRVAAAAEEEKSTKITFKPQINEYVPKDRKSGPVFERLFDLSVKNAQKKEKAAKTPKTPGEKPGSPPEKQK